MLKLWCIDLQKANYYLEYELTKSNKHIQDLSRTISKLTQFKQNIMQSLSVEDLSKVKSRVLHLPI